MTTGTQAGTTATDDDGAAVVEHDQAAIAVVEEQVTALFSRAKQLWKVAAQSIHPDVQPVGYRMLNVLVHRGPQSPGQLADFLDTDKSVISRQTRLLVELELIEAIPDPDDGRGRLLTAKPGTCDLVVATKKRMSATLFGGITALDPDELDQLGTLLARLNEASRG